MRALGFRNIAIIAAAGITLSGCASYYDGYGGYGGGYGGYGGGYGGLSVGIGTGGYYDPYYGSYYGSSYYGGSPYWGWNDGFYYPGTGYYVYDRYRRPHLWNHKQRSYWTQRRAAIGTTTTTTSTSVRPNWSGFSRAKSTATVTRSDRQERAQSRIERRQSKPPGVSTSTERSRRDRQPD